MAIHAVLSPGWRKFLTHCLVVLYSFTALGLLALLALNFSVLNPVAQTMKSFSMTDIYYHVLKDYAEPDTSHAITIVEMTDIHDRFLLGERIDEIEACHPKVLGIDIVFEGFKDEMGDSRVTQSATSYDNSVFSYRLRDWANDSLGYMTEIHSFFADTAHICEGFTNYERNLYGGLKRKANLRRRVSGETRSSLVLEVARKYSDGHIAETSTEDVNINFRPTVFRVVSSDSIAFYHHLIEDHIVLFGAMHELADMHYTPLGEMAGVELLAYTIQTLLEQSEVKHPSTWATIIISFLIVFITRIGRQAYLSWAKSFKSEWVVFFLTTTFVIGILLFLWSAVIMCLAFFAFVLYDISINLGWALGTIPFLYGANEFAILTEKIIFSNNKAKADERQELNAAMETSQPEHVADPAEMPGDQQLI